MKNLDNLYTLVCGILWINFIIALIDLRIFLSQIGERIEIMINRKVIGAKEFSQRVKSKLVQLNKDIKDDDLYFSQTERGYYMEYKPNYLEESNADIIIYQDLNGSISLYGNRGAVVPVTKIYENINDFEDNL